MAVTLFWQGPIGPGAFPAPYREDSLLFETLCQSGVYLRVKLYEGGRTVAYAGQSVSLLSRFDQHLSAMLSLAAPLRDASGAVVFSGDAEARIDAYDRLDEASAMAVADTRRVRFFYALCDAYFHVEHLNLAEGLLQRRIADRLSDVENAVAAPGRVPDDCPDVWENDFGDIDPEGRVVLEAMLGTAPILLNPVAGDAA